jgi:hypothetical protein
MDRTESTVRNMLAAIEAPLYDVGVLSDRGMLPGLDRIPRDAVIERLSLLKYRNARGSHIYIRPSGEHRYTVFDDLSEISLAKLTADGFTPCAVVETSAGNFQAWLKNPAALPKLLGTIAAQTLATRYDADLSAAGWRRFGRLPGFTNCKPKYRRPDGLFPFVRLKICSCEPYPMADTLGQEFSRLHEEYEQQREARRLQASLSPRGDRGTRICPSDGFGHPASTATVLPPQISPSVLPLMQMAWMRPGSSLPSKTTISLATLALPNERPTSGEP